MSEMVATPPQSTEPSAPARDTKNRGWTRIREALNDPNPIFVKEIRTVFRMNLFAFFLGGSALLIGLGVLLAGAVGMNENAQPAQIGRILFHLYFGLALAVVALIGPAFGASAITGEREQRTYEALLLSGLSPSRIVLGKFAASFASVGLVLIASLPAAGAVFFFGGVTPLHLLFAYLELFLWLIPTLAFGVALSARLRSTRGAIVLAVLVSAPVSLMAVLVLSGATSFAHRAWGVSMEGPFWIADALAMRPLSLDTLAYCVGCPAFVSLSLASFFLTTAVVALRGERGDRSTPLKLWALSFLAGLPFFLAALSFLRDASDRGATAVVLAASGGTLLLLYTFVFMNEPARAPRREPETLRERAAAWLGPGAGPTLRFSIATTIGFAAILSAVPWAVGRLSGPWDTRFDSVMALLFVGHAGYGLFLCALGAWLRIRLKNGLATRVVLGASLFAMTGAMWAASLLSAFDPEHTWARWLYALPAATAFSLAENHGWQPIAYLLPVALFTILGIAFWILVESAHAQVVRKARDRRAHLKSPPEAPIAAP